MSPNRPLAAVLTVMSAAAITSVQDVSIKGISGDYPFHEMQTIRCASAMLVVVPVLLWGEPLKALWQFGWPRILGRGLLYAIASVCFYLTAAAMPFPEAVALYYTMPLLVAALAGPVLGERVPLYRWIAVGGGFAGILVMMRPGSGVFEPAALIGVTCATLYAIGHLITRSFVAGISTAVIAVRGTIFDVLVKDNETEVYLHEGAVSVFNLTRPDQPVQLAPGQTTRITGTAQPRPPNTFKPGRNDGDFRSEEQRREDRQIADRRPDNRSDNDPGRNGSPQSGDRSPRDNQRTPGNADPGRLGGAPQPSAGRAPANNGGGGRRP